MTLTLWRYRVAVPSDEVRQNMEKLMERMNTEEAILSAARGAHEANRAFCIAIHDDSQLPWERAPIWQRDSAIAGVRFLIDNPEAGHSASHESWLALKTSEGWVFGEEKDVEKKTHPCCVPYDDLPEWQKAKDAIFGSVVRGVLDAYRMEV